MAEGVIELTDQNFAQEVLNSGSLVLVDFWAAWCGPCRTIAPIVEELAKEYAGRLKVGKLNVDENRETAARYNIRSIPSLLLFKDSEVLEQMIGVQPKQNLKKAIEKHI
jgi:thioredoxin 1